MKAVTEKGESSISTLENQFYVPKNPAFPNKREFAMNQHRLGYPDVLPESLNFRNKDNPIALRHDSDPASIRHHVDFCSQMIMPSNMAGVKQRDASVVEQTQSGTSTMRVLTLNMGNWERKPKVAGGHELPEECLFQYKLIHNHSSHIICINEAEKLSPSMLIDIVDKGFTGIRVEMHQPWQYSSEVAAMLPWNSSGLSPSIKNLPPRKVQFGHFSRHYSVLNTARRMTGRMQWFPITDTVPAPLQQRSRKEPLNINLIEHEDFFLVLKQRKPHSSSQLDLSIANASQERLGQLILEGKFPSTTTQRLRRTYSHDGTETVCVRFWDRSFALKVSAVRRAADIFSCYQAAEHRAEGLCRISRGMHFRRLSIGEDCYFSSSQ